MAASGLLTLRGHRCAWTAAPPFATLRPRQARPERTQRGCGTARPASLSWSILSITAQKVTFYDADGWILRAPVSTELQRRETPAGVFSGLQKDQRPPLEPL